jgi:hypothetical protein
MNFHAAIPSLRYGGDDTLIEHRFETNLFAPLRDIGTGRVRGVGNPLALR